jgi:hypothetical protein
MLNSQLFKNPHDYLQVVETGALSPMMEPETSSNLLVLKENEAMRTGKPVQAIMTDDHGRHVRGHKTILDDPGLRANPQLVQAVLMHIQEHVVLNSNMDPNLGALLKEEPPVAPGMSQPTQGQPQAPEGEPMSPNANSVIESNMPDMPAGSPETMQQSYEQSIK